MSDQNEDFRQALELFQEEAANFARVAIQDAAVRKQYLQLIRQMSDDILGKVIAGTLSPRDAADLAVAARNNFLGPLRDESSSLGKALAEWLKKNGRTLNELTDKYAGSKFKMPFGKLSAAQQNDVYVEIVKAAGRDNPAVSKWVSRLGKAGKVLAFVSIGVAIFNISTSNEKLRAAAKEGATLGGGILGGAAGGAAAGVVCGPGAPVCAGVGIIVGGILGGLGVDLAFDALWEATPEAKQLNLKRSEKPETLLSSVQAKAKESPIPRYKVVAGDSLSKIAAAIYGDANRWMLIYHANSHQITHPKKWLDRGQVLIIPIPGANHPEARKKWEEWFSKKYETHRAASMPAPRPAPTTTPASPAGMSTR
jgi:LysM repeat protein